MNTVVYVLVWLNPASTGLPVEAHNLIGVFTTATKARVYADWNASTNGHSIAWDDNQGQISNGHMVYVSRFTLDEADELF